MRCDPNTYRVLEIEKALAIVAGRCRSELGVARAFRSSPARDVESLRRRFDLLRAYSSAVARRGDYPWDQRVTPMEGLVRDAKTYGWLNGQELVKVRNSLILSSRIKVRLKEDCSEFEALRDLLRHFPDWEEELGRLEVLDEDGALYDGASTKLKELRFKGRELRSLARQRWNEILSNGSLASMLQDRVLTLRNGRFCALVRLDMAGSFPGLVVERSSSGNSVYVEPAPILPLNNRMAVIAGEEREEEQRILRALTEMLLSREGALLETDRGLGYLDLLNAQVELLSESSWVVPEVSNDRSFKLRSARHPLLGERAVPLDVSCGEHARMMVITGPNTGGKTVALKTVGVCVYLSWLGFPVPCAEGTVVGNLGELLADIGDEQSIEQNLSTFSGHIKQLRYIMESAKDRSLVLLDELGAGTDPEEGSALGVAILEFFLRRRCLLMATTHYNRIKLFAMTTPGVEAASMEFDSTTLQPTYRLLVGIPGSSNAILIAERLKLPREVIQRAREEMETRSDGTEALLKGLEARRAELEERLREVEALRAHLQERERLYEEKYGRILSDSEGIIRETRAKAQGIIKRAEEEAKALLKELRDKSHAEAQRTYQRDRDRLRKLGQAVEDLGRDVMEASPLPGPQSLSVGDPVEIRGSAVKGELAQVDGDHGVVVSGPMRIRVPLKKLVRSSSPLPVPQSRVLVSSPEKVSSSIMVRGMTLDEAMPIVERYLDQAYRAGYGEVEIIHGRGEGILRRAVHDLCRRLPFVESFRLGGPGEGGHGVTIVRFAR
ncbi:MutS2 family protein [Thermanaerovibrio acidaminovorans DSM 6589]|uniref:Endonuclease MutS2 n=1 Tax=Thermanaerovibrio acidaminovorans (strain ATCC 49978 / DSM 6589 / Su883) TaxID=525903 RepID=D1B9L4_THEAS|nr:endonuclease MutS2 [Thermanaerovibrio acidaminovorans]ACZ18967.1 MutS2 family protein [Thermanaerovibrio acidaminovorans DSM 6589]